MKLSKAFITEIVAQLVVVATVIVQQRLSPDDLAIAVAVIAAVEGIAAALAVHFSAADKIAALDRRVEVFVQGKR